MPPEAHEQGSGEGGGPPSEDEDRIGSDCWIGSVFVVNLEERRGACADATATESDLGAGLVVVQATEYESRNFRFRFTTGTSCMSYRTRALDRTISFFFSRTERLVLLVPSKGGGV